MQNVIEIMNNLIYLKTSENQLEENRDSIYSKVLNHTSEIIFEDFVDNNTAIGLLLIAYMINMPKPELGDNRHKCLTI